MVLQLSLSEDVPEFATTDDPPLRAASVDDIFFRKIHTNKDGETEWEHDAETLTNASGDEGAGLVLSLTGGGMDDGSSSSNHNNNSNLARIRSHRGKRRGRRPSRRKSEDSTCRKERNGSNNDRDRDASSSTPRQRRRSKPKRNSLLSKFLGSSKAKNGSSTGGGSTTSGETNSHSHANSHASDHANANDNSSSVSPPDEFNNSYNSHGSNSNNPLKNLTKIVRRNTLESNTSSNKSSGGWLSHQGSMSTGVVTLSPEERKIAIANLQLHAEDLEAEGKPDDALDLWQEALELVEEEQAEDLTSKNEILCKLVVLHLAIAKEQAELLHFSQGNFKEDQVSPPSSPSSSPPPSPPPPSSSYSNNKESVHHQAAKRYLNRITDASMVQSEWLGQPSQPLLDFLVQVEAWELAILVLQQLQAKLGVDPDHHELATLHYQVACQKLDAQRHEEALRHLQSTVTYLQQVPQDELDTTLYRQVLRLLANEYQSQQEYDSALEIYQEEMKFAPLDQKPSLYCQMAKVHLANGKLEQALEQIAMAKQVQEEVVDADRSHDISSHILQTEGDVFFRLGRTEESLECYQQALHETESSPADKAKLLYTMGKICVRLGRMRSAITYFTRELEITKQELGPNHLSVSRVLHELAKLYDEGLGEHKIALLKLNKAMAVELGNLQECHIHASNCQHCNQQTHELCSRHAHQLRQATAQIRETKKCQGRIYYKLGDLERAMKTSFMEAQGGIGGGVRRSSAIRGRRHSLF